MGGDEPLRLGTRAAPPRAEWRGTMNRHKALRAALAATLAAGLLTGCTSGEPSTSTASSLGTSTAPPGSITVALTDLAGHEGEHVAGVLLKGFPGADTTGVAGFWTRIDADPFTQQLVLGNVPQEFPDEPDGMGWPWPAGVADIPPGDYTLAVWMAKDNFCCYSQWLPALTTGLTGCETQVTATGEPQTITVENLTGNFRGACTAE